MPNSPFIWWGVEDFQIKPTVNYLVVAVSCKEGCMPKSTTKLGWLVKVKSIQLVPLKVELVHTEVSSCQAWSLQMLFYR